MEFSRKSLLAAGLLSTMLNGAALAQQNKNPTPVAGVSAGVVGITVEEMVTVAQGWSIKRQILGKTVHSEKNDKIGKVEDVIVTPDKSLSYAIVSVGGFLGMGKHDVAIPINQLKADKDGFLLTGVSKDVLKAMPRFEYSHK